MLDPRSKHVCGSSFVHGGNPPRGMYGLGSNNVFRSDFFLGGNQPRGNNTFGDQHVTIKYNMRGPQIPSGSKDSSSFY
jgi:hypothetical protein